MSTMLEQAIIDAEALKEAAIKNAETAVIEKYADNIREAVDALLEQEDELGLEDELAEEDLGMMGGDEFGAEEGPVPADTIPDAPPAVTDGESLCPCPEEDEEITIDFNQLAAAVEEEEAALEGGEMGSLDDLGGLGGLPGEEEEEDPFALQEELSEDAGDEVEEGMVDAGYKAAKERERKEKAAKDAKNKKDSDDDDEELSEEEQVLADFIEEELSDLDEKLTVDHKPQPLGVTIGHGVPAAVAEAEADEALAAMRDTENAEELKKAKKAIKDLQEQTNKLLDAYNENKAKYIKVITHLKEKVEKTNLSNAKLLYTNRILNSGSLNERQINKVVEAISNASTVEEAKVIFETLQSAVESSSSKRGPESLSEAISKRSSPFMPRRDKPVASDNSELNRWKHLAGIK